MKNRYAAIVVLYRANKKVLKNIESYYSEVEEIFLIDNTETEKIKKDLESFENKCKYIYISLGKNMGLAYALNYGCNIAVEKGYNYVLTMDQDSIFEIGSVDRMKKFIENSHKEYAIVAPNVKAIYDKGNDYVTINSLLEKKDNPYQEFEWVITSGSFLNMKFFKQVNGFDNSLFIEHIDIDYCIKIKLIEQKIIVLNNAVLNQRYGNLKEKNFLWRKIYPSYYNPERYYYLFRNRILLKNKYDKKIIRIFFREKFIKRLIKVWIYEDYKIEKTIMSIKGIIDGKKGQTGKYEL